MIHTETYLLHFMYVLLNYAWWGLKMFISKNLLKNIWEHYYCVVSFCGRI